MYLNRVAIWHLEPYKKNDLTPLPPGEKKIFI